MKNSIPEKTFIGVLFIVALLVFSFAEKESKKLDGLYKNAYSEKSQKVISSSTKQLPLANINVIGN